jgi:hypothetical protein
MPRSSMLLQMFLHEVHETMTIILMGRTARREIPLEEVFSKWDYAFCKNLLHQAIEGFFLVIIILRIDQETLSFHIQI